MRRTAKLLEIAMIAMCLSHTAFGADLIGGDVSGPALRLDADTVFMDDAYVCVARIDVLSAINMENRGLVDSDIYVCSGCDFYVRNTGKINGRIYLGDDANMVQLIRDVSDLTRLNVNSSYTVMVDSAENLSLSALSKIAPDAGHIILRDSVINLDTGGDELNSGVELQGNVTIVLPAGYSVSSRPLLHNVSGDASVVIDADSVGPLYSYNVYVQDDDLFVRMVRDTDYVKILGGDLGRALNSLRVIRPDDSLLGRLDAARTMDELFCVLSHSVAVHPYLLSNPIRMTDNFVKNFSYVDGAGAVVQPFYISADEFDISGAVGGLYFDVSKSLRVGVSVYGSVSESYDSINDFTADMYGANVNLGYYDNLMFARIMLGTTYGDFDVPYIFVGDSVETHNIDALSRYVVSDVGININLTNVLTLAPYVGAEYEYIRVLHDAKSDLGLRAGADVVYSITGVDLRYDYKIGADYNTMNWYHIRAGVDWWSPDDGSGMGVNIGLMRNTSHTAYVFSISASTEF